MKLRKFTQGITFFTTPQMYQDVKRASDEQEVSLSEFFRDLITKHFQSNHNENPKNKEIKES